MARGRNRDAAVWAVICFLFPFIGVIALAIAGDATPYTTSPSHIPETIVTYVERAPLTKESSSENTADYDRKKWNALLEYDDELSSAVQRVSAYGNQYKEQLAKDYMVIGDKSYLNNIVEKIEAKAKAENQYSQAMQSEIVEAGEYWGVKWSRRGDGITYGEFDDGLQEFLTKSEFESAVKRDWRARNAST